MIRGEQKEVGLFHKPVGILLHAVKRDPSGNPKLCRPLFKGLLLSAITDDMILDGNACIHTGSDSI